MSMILIFSENKDVITDEVCLYLRYQNKDFLRINIDDCDTWRLEVKLSNSQLIMDIIHRKSFEAYSLSNIKTTWFRRGEFSFEFCKSIITNPVIDNCDTINRHLLSHVENEILVVKQFFYQYLKEHTLCINSPELYNANKLLALYYAKEIGFPIPDTIVTTEKKTFDILANKYDNKIITKCISDWHPIFTKNHVLNINTVEIPESLEIPELFNYSLFQNCIEKQFEVRTFVWDQKTYSAAIYSCNNQAANVDYRKNYESTRITPFQLPLSVEKKVFFLMNKLGINSGSIDFIVTNNCEYIFLEINPVGQFEFLDKICNYNLPQIISKTLAQS